MATGGLDTNAGLMQAAWSAHRRRRQPIAPTPLARASLRRLHCWFAALTAATLALAATAFTVSTATFAVVAVSTATFAALPLVPTLCSTPSGFSRR